MRDIWAVLAIESNLLQETDLRRLYLVTTNGHPVQHEFEEKESLKQAYANNKHMLRQIYDSYSHSPQSHHGEENARDIAQAMSQQDWSSR
jgi:hypothetical protein